MDQSEDFPQTSTYFNDKQSLQPNTSPIQTSTPPLPKPTQLFKLNEQEHLSLAPKQLAPHPINPDYPSFESTISENQDREKPDEKVPHDQILTNFFRIATELGAMENSLTKIQQCINEQGYFSPLVTEAIKSECGVKGIGKKIQKAYRNSVLNQLILPILTTISIQIRELQAQKLDQLYKSIASANEQGIIQFLEELIDTDNPIFLQSVQSLLRLHTLPTNIKSKIQNPANNSQNQSQDLNSQILRQLQLEKQQFHQTLIQKGIKLDSNSIELIMNAKFNQGSFSKQIDQIIKNLPLAKNLKTKTQKTFDDLFRNIQIPKHIALKFSQLGIEQNQIKDIKNYIRKNQTNKIRKILQEYSQDQKQILSLLDELIDLRPIQAKSSTFLQNSSSSTIQEMNEVIHKSISQSSISSSPIQEKQFQSPQKPSRIIEQKHLNSPVQKGQESQKDIEKTTGFQEIFENFPSISNHFEDKKSFDQVKQGKDLKQKTSKIKYRQKSPQTSKERPQTFRKNQNHQMTHGQPQHENRGKNSNHHAQAVNHQSKNYKHSDIHYDHNKNQKNNLAHQKNQQPWSHSVKDAKETSWNYRFKQSEEVKPSGDDSHIRKDRNINDIFQYYEQQWERNPQLKKGIPMISRKSKHQKGKGKNQMSESQSFELDSQGFQSHYIMVLHEKSTKFTIRRPHEQYCIDQKYILVDRREEKHLVGSIIRLNFDQETEILNLQFPKGGFFGTFKPDNKITYWRKMFSQSQLLIECIVDQKAINCQEYYDLILFYLMVVLDQCSKNKDYAKFWCTLIGLEQYCHPSSNEFQFSLKKLEQIMNKRKISFDPECSRLFLYFFVTHIQKGIPIEMESNLLYPIALVSNFQQYRERPFFFNQNYHFQFETKLILYCMLHRYSRNLSVHEQTFCQNLTETFALVHNYDQKMKLIKSLKKQCNQKLQELYPMIKESINLQNYDLYQFLSMRLALINIEKPNYQPNHGYYNQMQKHSNNRLDDQKRLWIIQMIREIKNLIENMPQNEIKSQNALLKRVNEYHSNEIRQILLGKNKNSSNFLFNHQLFFDFYSELVFLKEQYKLELLHVFEKSFSEGHKIKAIELVILRSQKCTNMIAFVCNLDKQYKINLEEIIKRMQPKGNLLNTINCWFKDYYKEENHDFFIQIFTLLMEICKGQFFTPYELMKTVQYFYDIEMLAKPVEKLFKALIQRMRRLPQLSPDLKFHLMEIKDIKLQIRKIYLNELSIRLEQSKVPLEKLERTASEILSQASIPKTDSEIILKKLFQNRNDKPKDILKKQIIEYYSLNKKQMKVLSYYNSFKNTLKNLIQEIQDKEVSYSTIQNMKKVKLKTVTKNQVNQFKTMALAVDQIVNQIQTIKKKSNSLIKVLTTYGDTFRDKIEALEDWIKKVSSTQVKISMRNIKKFNDYLEYSDEMNSLMKIPLWEHEKIFSMEDLLKMRTNTIEEYRQLISSFQKKTLNYTDFKKYFKIDILSTLLENVQDKDQSFKIKLSQYINYLDDRTLNQFVISINAVNDISAKINKNQFFQSTYLQIVQFLQNPPNNSNLTIEDAFKKIRAVDSKFKQIAFDVLQQDQEILKTLIFRCNYKRVFEMIAQKKIDSLTVLNDLKEYINDVENSILKIQDIKQLENIVLFNEILNRAGNFKSYLNDLRKEVKAKNLKLSQNLFNIDSKLKLFEQMIDSSSNRETSFKYDLQQIFKDSIVRIKQDNGFAHVQIMIKQKNLINEGPNPSKQNLGVFTFKKLSEFKDKAILLVSDFQRSAQNQNIMQQTIDLFKQYLSLYKILQEIQLSLDKVIIYGYNPLDLKQQQSIKNTNFQSVSKMKTQIQILSKEWIQGMKDMYEKSYLLTHFMGPKLNAFINDILQFKFSPLIKQIVDLNQVEFGQRMDGLKFIDANKGINSPIEKVKQICRMFEKTQAQTLQKYEKYSIVEEGSIKNKIQLITCHKVENYYFALVKGNSKPQMNEILYCQKETSFEEIEVFIKRAIIKNLRKHYFIGVHYLPTEVQLKFIDLLNDYLKSQTKRMKFNRSKLCFIDDSPVQKVYLHLCKKQLFDAKQITDTHLKTEEQKNYVLKNIGQTFLVQSRIPGLGKTHWAQKKVRNSNIVYFSIAGHIHFSRLLQRLKSKRFVEGKANTLIIQIGHVENKNKLEIFLFQIIFFKGFNFKEFFFLPKNSTVIVEMQNVYDTEDKYQFYSILKIIKEHKENYNYIDKFELKRLQPDFSCIQQAFVYYYLVKMHQKTILKDQQRFDRFSTAFHKNPQLRICTNEDARKLIQYYFVSALEQGKTQPTFWLYSSFIKMLFTAFKTFSLNDCFNVALLQSNNRANRNLGLANVRLDFLHCCVNNCIQFIQATINTNEFKQEEDETTKAKQIRSEEQDFRQKLTKFPFLILPAYDFHNYEFVYLNSDTVNISIKSLIISQSIFKYIRFNKHGYDKGTLERKLDQQIVSNLFSENSLEHLKEENLEREIYRILHQISGNDIFNISDKMPVKQFKNIRQDIKNYSITLDNFFKMCLIVQRAVSSIPIIIMGESGVGKTALIKFLVQVVYGHNLLIFNIHAGIDEQKITDFYRQILQASETVKTLPKQKVWVFFDQFNTTDELSYIKEMIIDKKFQGEPVPENVVLIGACNPYRQRKQTKFKRAGIKKKNTEHYLQTQDNLAFKVKPPSLSMIQFMWDYQQLQFKQNLHYISKILENLNLKEHQKVVQTIASLHEDFKKTYEISSVSLRDVARFKELFLWFMQMMPDSHESNTNPKQINPNYKMDRQQRAISLSVAFCYSLRIADRQQRKELLRVMSKQLEFDTPIEQVVQNEQVDYVKRLKIATERIAINFSLRENVFTTLVCLMNKIPILIIGNPGNSKSLSIRMISSNLRGLNSQSKFCRQFPELSIIYFQGSEACTSKGVEAVFQKAIDSNIAFKKKKQKQQGLGDVQNCVLFDEIGLAQKSIHNPLKVLHSKLETNNKEICFIGISNWELDAAKMSRFLVLSRSNPEKEELRDTALKILESYINRQAYKHEKTFRQMSDWYFDFINNWDHQHKNTYKQGFFGLRDFYCYIKFVAQELEKQSKRNLNEIIRGSILTNFDGQQGSVEMFLEIAGLNKFDEIHLIEPVKIVQQNLSKDSSRCLLLIVRGDALLPIIKDRVKINGERQRIECLYGSTFALDQQSEEYNLEMTSMIISHMSRGTVLAFKNPNNSIQTSLYDVFNKSFTYSGPKKYCRVAVGANSNPKCVVNDSFGSIVFMDEEVIQNTDLAFLNRFQKHFLTLSNVLSQYEKEVVNQINTWIASLIRFKANTQYKKQQHYLINSSEQSIVTLAIKNRESLENYRQSGIKKIKKALLKNATQHFHIALKSEQKKFITPGLTAEVKQLLKQIENQKTGSLIQIEEETGFQDIFEKQNISRDKIIFTYDEGIYSAPTYMFHTQKTLKIRISEVKSEKELRKSLKEAFNSQKFDNVHILIDFQKQFQHVNFVAFLITGIKNQFKSNKTIYLIIKLSQTSLDNAGRDHINISYLLDFQQRFIDSLTIGKSFMEAISNKTIKQIYIERGMEQNFDNFYIEAQKRFRLLQNQKDIPKGLPAKDLKDFQFGEMMQMHQNSYFKKEALNFIYENLAQTKIDVSIILSNREDRNLCSSPQESFEKYIQNVVIQQICLFFERVYGSNLLFSFDPSKLFAFYKKYYDVQIMEIIYDQCKDIYDKFFVHAIEKFVKFKAEIVKQYMKNYNSNPLQIKSVCLLPVGLRELQYISSNSDDSLFKTSSKILQLSVSSEAEVIQQCQILIERCMSILHEKSVFLKSTPVKGSFDFESYLNENPSLQIFYFFDMISKIYSESIESININTSIFPLQKLVYLFVQIFKKLEIKQKIILLSLSKELWSNIFNVWSLWITHREQNFHRTLQTHYLQNHYISTEINQAHQLPKLLIELCKSTLVMQQQLLKLDINTIQNYGIEKYLSFFRKTYLYIQKIRLTCMDLQVNTSQTMKATKRFFDLLDNIFDKNDIQEQLTIFLTTQEHSFQAKVENYLSKVIKSSNSSKKNIEHILSYLSLEIYSSWIQRLKQDQQNGFHVDQEIQNCIESFIEYSDRFPSFANNSSFFLQNIFDDFIESIDTIPEKLEYFEQQRDEIVGMVNEGLIMQNNFAVALGNFFMTNIEQCAFAEQTANQQNKAIDEVNNDSFIKRHLKLFQNSMRKTNFSSKVLEILTIEFIKYYCAQYLCALENGEEPSTTWKVDELLSETSNIAGTMRLYLLKKILYREQKMTLVKEKYLDSKKCKWLENFRGMVSGTSFQLLVPPPFEQQQPKINELINRFRQDQYQKMELFEEILKESFASPISKYEFLTFMMNDIYTRSCPQDRILKIQTIINNSEYYKDVNNTVEYNLLQAYIDHKITSAIKYQTKEQQLPQKKIEEFVNTQLVFINYINIFVSCNKQECPLIEMFFDLRGNFPENYINWLQKRFLVNGRQNQSVSILKRFIELADNTPGYYKCSTKCDMFYTIGGSGGFGCQLPRVEGRCGWCNEIIGGTNHVLTRASEGARKVDLAALPTELEQIREKRKLQILNHKLNGYSYSSNSQEMIREVQSNRRLPDSVKYVLQQMVFSVWSFLCGTSLMNEETIKEIFHINSKAFEHESFEIMQNFYRLETKTINLNEQDQSSIVWHLGISKQIMKFIIGYKSQLTHDMKQKMGLVKCIGRDTFEQYLSNNIILRHSSGNDKLALVNQSRCLRSGRNLSGQEILRQTGGFEEHLENYPRIRLIKLLQEDKVPCFNNLVKEYKQIINRDYKILAYYIDNQEEIEKLISFRTLYTFITKILKLFNMKITRRDAQTKSILNLYEEFYLHNSSQTHNSSRLNAFREEVLQFCRVWNKLRQLKFQLRYGCHMLGFMNEVLEKLQPTSKAINLFPDSRFKGDQKGEMILSLLQVTSQQYNEVCRAIQHRKMGEKKYRQIQIFNPKPINPTQIQPLTKTLELSRQLIEGQFVANFSNWSVEYGCGLPYYSIDKIESLMVENIVGCHNLNEQIKEYDSINFIGEQLNFIIQIRSLGSQQPWDKVPKKQDIEKFLINFKHQKPDSFLKEITTIKGSLQLILHYCRLQKGTNFEHITIEQFIHLNKINILSQILRNQELFYALQMKFILAIYEFIELYTLKNSAECLDDSYKKQNLSPSEEKTIKLFLEEIKKQSKPDCDLTYHLMIAIYRFVARSLLLVEWNQSLTLFEFLYEGQDLWPHDFDMSKLAEVKYFNESLSITLTKIQSLLEMIPFELKKTKTQALLMDQKKATYDGFGRNEPERLKPLNINQKKKKNL